MGSYLHPKDNFDLEDLDRIEAAFNNIWSIVVANDPFRDTRTDEELKQGIRHKLCALAQLGLVDADLLAGLALQTASLSWIRNGRAQLTVIEDGSPNGDRSKFKCN